MLLRRRLVWQFLKVLGLSMVLSTLGAVLLVAAIAGFPPQSPAAWTGLLLLSGLATLIVSSILASRLVSPILEDLTNSFQKVSTGDYSAELKSASHERAQEVGIEFDRMTELLGRRASLLSDDRNRLRTVIDSMFEGVIAVDPSQQVLLVNAAACRLFNIRETTSVGRPLWELIRNTRVQ
ncbi:MAG: PAS domain-containing protein, partial [Planctomycetaceae bacterium]|nr:PAS domain-containing protein [Planctomycetaceae bacterium]